MLTRSEIKADVRYDSLLDSTAKRDRRLEDERALLIRELAGMFAALEAEREGAGYENAQPMLLSEGSRRVRDARREELSAESDARLEAAFYRDQ